MPQFKPRAQGRSDLSGAREPANGLGRPAPSYNVRTGIVAVDDPMEPGRRILATVNRRVDVLEDERAHNRLSEAAYQEGRRLQRLFELRNRIGATSGQGGSSLTADQRAGAKHEHLAVLIDKTAAELKWLERKLGMIDLRLVRRILGERMDYAAAAAMEGKSGERGARYVAFRFRDALELLAEKKAARGRAT